MRQRFMDSIPWTTLLVGVGVGTALAVTPRIAHADHKLSLIHISEPTRPY